MQGCANGLWPGRFHRGLLHFRQTQGQQSGQTIADGREKPGQRVIVLYQQGECAGGRQETRHAHTVIHAKGLLAVLPLAGQIQDAGVHAGKAGQDDAEHDPLQQKAGKSIRLPKDKLGEEIQPGTEDHGPAVADAVGNDAPWNLQQNTQGQRDAFDKGDLQNGNPLSLAVQGGNGAVKHHALQQRNGVEKVSVFSHKKSPF